MLRTSYPAIAALALAALLCPTLRMPAIAGPADIAACDRLAAHPTDPDRPADVTGHLEITEADLPTALKACKAAAAAPNANWD